jgi:hypothetical protein
MTHFSISSVLLVVRIVASGEGSLKLLPLRLRKHKKKKTKNHKKPPATHSSIVSVVLAVKAAANEETLTIWLLPSLYDQ